MTWAAVTTPTRQLEQLWSGADDELLQLGLQVGGLRLEEQRLPSADPQCAHGAAVLDLVLRQGAQPGAAVELLVGGTAAQLVAQLFGCADDERLELADRLGAGPDRASSGGEQDPHRFAIAALPRLGEVLAGQRLPSGPDSVDLVALGAVAPRGSSRPVDLDNPLAVLEQVRGQFGAEAAGALDGPRPAARSLLADEGEHPPVAERVSGELDRRAESPGWVDDGDGVLVAVGVDPDDGVDRSCQHGHAVLLFEAAVNVGIGPGCGHRAAGL